MISGRCLARHRDGTRDVFRWRFPSDVAKVKKCRFLRIFGGGGGGGGRRGCSSVLPPSIVAVLALLSVIFIYWRWLFTLLGGG
jgi:hypothetical protein